jgi:predicted nucleic acid-binding protein
MLVLDSSVWIEWLRDSGFASRIESIVRDQEEMVVPTIVQLEVYKWLMREKDRRQAEAFLAYSQQQIVLPLTTFLAVRAAEAHQRHKLATADAIIYATALHMEADLLTCDAHFKDLPGVVFLDKGV